MKKFSITSTNFPHTLFTPPSLIGIISAMVGSLPFIATTFDLQVSYVWSQNNVHIAQWVRLPNPKCSLSLICEALSLHNFWWFVVHMHVGLVCIAKWHANFKFKARLLNSKVYHNLFVAKSKWWLPSTGFTLWPKHSTCPMGEGHSL